MNRLKLFVLSLLGLALFFGLVIAVRWFGGTQDHAPVPVLQQPQPIDGITMLPATVAVDPDLQAAVARVLASTAPERKVWVYAITDVTARPDDWIVSVAGMPDDAVSMNLEYSIWLGTVTIKNTAAMPGSVDEQQPFIANSLPAALGSDVAAIDYAYGDSPNIMPWRNTTTATYGMLGVHNCGYSLNGWYAVDLFPAENQVYASTAGSATYVCRDENQVSMRIGNNLYAHLADTGQQVGDPFSQGQALGSLVPGTFNSACGYASQQPDAYHLHFCFVPNPGGTWSADGYAVNISGGETATWVKGEEQVAPLDYLTADWSNADVTPPGGDLAFGNFWDSLVGGVISMATNSMETMPLHQDQQMSTIVMGNLSPAYDLMSLILFSSFDMTVVLWVVAILFVLETVRIVYASWMWIKKAIPIIG